MHDLMPRVETDTVVMDQEYRFPVRLCSNSDTLVPRRHGRRETVPRSRYENRDLRDVELRAFEESQVIAPCRFQAIDKRPDIITRTLSTFGVHEKMLR